MKKTIGILAVLCLLASVFVGCSSGNDMYAGTKWISNAAIEAAEPVLAKLACSTEYIVNYKFATVPNYSDTNAKAIEAKSTEEAIAFAKKTEEEQKEYMATVLTWYCTNDATFQTNCMAWAGSHESEVDGLTPMSEDWFKVCANGVFEEEAEAYSIDTKDIIEKMIAAEVKTYADFGCIQFNNKGKVTIPGALLDKEGEQTVDYCVEGTDAYLVKGAKIYKLAYTPDVEMGVGAFVLYGVHSKTAAYNDMSLADRAWVRF